MASPPVDRAAPPQPGAPPAYRAPSVVRRTLANGLDLWIVERRTTPLTAVRLVLDAGALREPAHQAGLASLTGMALAEGTATRSASAIADGLGDLGAELQRSVTSDAAVLALSVLSRNLPGALEILADMARNAVIPEAPWTRIRKQRLAQILAAADNPQTLATQHVSALAYGADHPYGRPASGTPATVARLTAADARAFHDAYYRPDNAALIVVGDVRAADLVPLVERVLGSWEPGGVRPPLEPAPPPVGSGAVIHLVDRPGSSQSEIRVALPGIARGDPAFAPLSLLNAVIGGYRGRLWRSLREERGYTYSAGSVLDARRFAGQFLAYTAVETGVTAQALTELLRQIREIRDARPITPQELESARRRILGEDLFAAESNAQIAARLQDLVLSDLPADFHERFSQEIRRLTYDDVSRALAQRFPLEPLTIVVVGDRSRVEDGLRGLGIPVRLVDRPTTPAERGAARP